MPLSLCLVLVHIVSLPLSFLQWNLPELLLLQHASCQSSWASNQTVFHNRGRIRISVHTEVLPFTLWLPPAFSFIYLCYDYFPSEACFYFIKAFEHTDDAKVTHTHTSTECPIYTTVHFQITWTLLHIVTLRPNLFTTNNCLNSKIWVLVIYLNIFLHNLDMMLLISTSCSLMISTGTLRKPYVCSYTLVVHTWIHMHTHIICPLHNKNFKEILL